jgi:hypothetical protein
MEKIKPSEPSLKRAKLDSPKAPEADKHRLWAQQLLNDFAAAHGGRHCRNIDELTAWAASRDRS